MPKPRPYRFNEFCRFYRFQCELNDHDPHVAVFSHLADTFNLSTEERIWMSVLFMAYYQDGSAWAAFSSEGVRDRKVLPPGDLIISKQRRNLFGGRILKHFQSVYEIKSLKDWLTVKDWAGLISNLKTVYGNGRWASYTTAEMVQSVAKLPVEPDTYDIFDSSGPKQGLEFLRLKATEGSAERVRSLIEDKYGEAVSPQVLESALCNWSRINKPRSGFYAGQNLDRQQARLLATQKQLPSADLSAVWQARRKVLPNYALGELNGWDGVDKARKQHYLHTGEILDPRNRQR